MPLDVQPLSPLRRLLMLATLLILFAGSLGFAQFLVMRRPGITQVEWNVPAEFKPGAAPAPDCRVWTGNVAGHARTIFALSETVGEIPTPQERTEIARDLYVQLVDADPKIEQTGNLAGQSAVELEGVDEAGDFQLFRMAVLGDTAVAICYSGRPPLTDADTDYFDRLCRHVEVHRSRSAK